MKREDKIKLENKIRQKYGEVLYIGNELLRPITKVDILDENRQQYAMDITICVRYKKIIDEKESIITKLKESAERNGKFFKVRSDGNLFIIIRISE